MIISHTNTKLKPLIQSDFRMIILEDLGTVFATYSSKQKTRMAIFKCNQCSKTPRIMVHHAKKNQTEICPFCANSNAKKTHGLSKHKEYDRYKHMMDRCYNKNNPRYIDYGGRGVRVSSEFIDLKTYIDYIDSLPYSKSKNRSIDRIDNNKDYERGNLRWATLETQARNTRKLCKSNTSGYRGVSWSKSYKKWKTQIVVNRVWITIGHFINAKDAGLAYDKYVLDNNLEHTTNF